MTTELVNIETARSWLRDGRRVVRALLIEAEGSAPLPPGASMLIDDRGGIEGSITGGCVEGAVIGEAAAVLETGQPRLVTYGFSDELAGTVGLTCGGIVHIFVHELSAEAATTELAALDAVAAGRPVAVATLIDGDGAGAKFALVDGRPIGSFGGPDLLDRTIARDAAGLLDRGVTTVRRYGSDGAVLGAEIRVHVLSYVTSPRMLIIGAIDFSAALARLASEVGFAVTIADAREAFLTSSRFSDAASVVVGWPENVIGDNDLGPRDAVLVFTHDPKFDERAIVAALATRAGYIGALGSRRTTEDRERRLLAAGTDPGELLRVHAPCGLDIGSSTPEEVAISVLAEIVASRSGRDGGPLHEATGSIQPREGKGGPTP